MRLRTLMRSICSSLREKRKSYKFDKERPSNEEIKEYLRKRRALRSGSAQVTPSESTSKSAMDAKIAEAMRKLKEMAHADV